MPLPIGFRQTLQRTLLCSSLGVFSTVSHALYLDGQGHYALRGEIRTAPGMAEDSGQFQAIDQSLRLMGEARFNDNSSFFMEFRLFDDPQKAYLGDTVQPQECPAGSGEACTDAYQNVREPGYKPYVPRVTKAYVRYAFDYCILEAGRRGRQWGLGMFLDAGEDPFATSASIFDGVSCDINIQKSQTLGVLLGYDKLAETGTYVREGDGSSTRFGATNPHDDINQFYLTIEYDDRKANAGSTFTKQIGIYAAKVSSAEVSKGGSSTDLNFIDLYTNLYIQNFALRNEFLLTFGETADPNSTRLGGALDDRGEPAVNKFSNSLAIAGQLEWTIASSGGHVGPAVYRQGDAKRHVLFLNYAFAPGDSEGYYNDPSLDSGNALSIAKRSGNAEAMAFHRNFKPALIMFNGRAETEQLAVDGIFDPRRLMNALVYSLGYRYESLSIGNFEVKGTYGLLNESMPASVTAYYEANPELTRPVGYYGNSLGVELDLMYWYHWNRDVDLGVAAGALFPGEAWKIKEEREPANNYLGQLFVAFRF